MPFPNLPNTEIRLATSASIYVLREDAISLAAFFQSIFSPRTTLTTIIKEMQQLYGIVSFYEDQNRAVEPRWEVDSDVLGSPLETLSSPITGILRMKRAVFYRDGGLIDALGFENQIRQPGTQDVSLASQTQKTPFIIIKKDAAPAGVGIAPVVTFYRRCMLAQLTVDYNVAPGSNLGVFEDATMYYGERQQYTTTGTV